MHEKWKVPVESSHLATGWRWFQQKVLRRLPRTLFDRWAVRVPCQQRSASAAESPSAAAASSAADTHEDNRNRGHVASSVLEHCVGESVQLPAFLNKSAVQIVRKLTQSNWLLLYECCSKEVELRARLIAEKLVDRYQPLLPPESGSRYDLEEELLNLPLYNEENDTPQPAQRSRSRSRTQNQHRHQPDQDATHEKDESMVHPAFASAWEHAQDAEEADTVTRKRRKIDRDHGDGAEAQHSERDPLFGRFPMATSTPTRRPPPTRTTAAATATAIATETPQPTPPSSPQPRACRRDGQGWSHRFDGKWGAEASMRLQLLGDVCEAYEGYQEWAGMVCSWLEPLEWRISQDREASDNPWPHTPGLEEVCKLQFRNWVFLSSRLVHPLVLSLYSTIHLLYSQASHPHRGSGERRAPDVDSILSLLDSLSRIIRSLNVPDDTLSPHRSTQEEHDMYFVKPMSRLRQKWHLH